MKEETKRFIIQEAKLNIINKNDKLKLEKVINEIKRELYKGKEFTTVLNNELVVIYLENGQPEIRPR